MVAIAVILKIILMFILLDLVAVTPAFFNDDDQGNILDFGFEGLDASAKIYPADIFLFIGDRMSVYCELTKYAETSHASDIILYSEKSGVSTKLNTSAINSTFATAVLEGTKEMMGMSTINCKAKTDDGVKQLISESVTVQEPLQNVTNVSSILHYSTKTYEVSWDLGVSYYNLKYKAVEVQITLLPNNRTDKAYSCSKKNETFCRIDDYKLETILFIHFTVKVREQLWNAYKDNMKYFVKHHNLEFPTLIHEVQPLTKVKTDKPSSVRIVEKSSHCFNISWENPPYFVSVEEDALFSITAQNTGDETNPHKKIIKSTLQLDNFDEPVPICGLHPHAWYTLILSLMPINGSYWSDPAEIVAKTLEDRPEFGPPVTPSSFWVGICSEGKRDIILYWKDLQPTETNGELINFRVKFNSESGKVRASENNMKAERSCNVTYNIEIYSATKVGETLHPSKIIIPSENEIEAFQGPYPVDLKVEILNGSVEMEYVDVNVTWDVKDPTRFQGVYIVLYLCKGQAFNPKVCLDDFKNISVPFERHFLHLQHMSRSTNRFGFALEKKGTNHVTGIRWTDCIYNRNEKPKQVTGVSAHPGEKVGSILVVWKTQSCSKETLALVQRYQVEYCPKSQSRAGSECPVKVVEGADTSTLELYGLDMGETYSIRVSAVAMSGKGLSSEPVMGTPHNSSDDDEPSTPVIIVVILFSLILGAILCFCIRRNFKRRKAKMSNMIPRYTMFDIIGSEKDDDDQKSDSGISTQAISSNQSNNTQITSSNNVTGYTNKIHSDGDDEDNDIDPYVHMNCSANPTTPADQSDDRINSTGSHSPEVETEAAGLEFENQNNRDLDGGLPSPDYCRMEQCQKLDNPEGKNPQSMGYVKDTATGYATTLNTQTASSGTNSSVSNQDYYTVTNQSFNRSPTSRDEDVMKCSYLSDSNSTPGLGDPEPTYVHCTAENDDKEIDMISDEHSVLKAIANDLSSCPRQENTENKSRDQLPAMIVDQPSFEIRDDRDVKDNENKPITSSTSKYLSSPQIHSINQQLVLRKISEDEGISSPSVDTEAPQYPSTDREQNFVTFANPDQPSSSFVEVDISALIGCDSSDYSC